MKYLITGGAGFIGSNIVEELLRRGESVRVLDNFSTGKRENIAKILGNIELIEGDIRSYHVVREAVDGVDVILHQAALPSVPRSIKDPITSNEVNVTGTLNILTSAKDAKVRRVVFASSSSIYGDTPELPKHEKMIPNPLSPYAVSKLTGEKYCNVFAKAYGLHTVALRYFNVFGPKQDPTSFYSAVIPKFITTMMKGESPIIFGDGTQSRDFTFITNVVNANILASTVDCPAGITVNIACNQSASLNQLVENIGKNLGVVIQPTYQSPRNGDIKDSLAAITLASQHLNYRPVVSFDDGLLKTVEWFKRQTASI
jgi:UDP-glucose 4-epimerase